ncbi:hypothetical protein [Oceanobacter kriegii]|uniref:hypothetical protein n=1 Tax=Oceanobacter kriegii TaxID=64972 RepID=UPI000406C6B1|nr:hypothetical protein [Oceanobacter kriegii]
MASLLICDSPVINDAGFVSCSAWSMVDYEFVEAALNLTTFDAEIFGTVLGSLLLSFITGHVAGLVIRLLNRT